MRVVVLFGSRQERDRLIDALPGAAEVAAADTLREARALLDRPDVRVCVVFVAKHSAPYAIGAIRELHAAFPALTLVAACDVHELDRQSLVATIRAGAVDLIFRDIDDGPGMAQHVLAHAVHRTQALELWGELEPQLPAVLRPYVRHGVLHAMVAEELTATAELLGISRRTLAKRLETAGAPSPRRLFTWTRLLVAGALLTDRGRSMQSVAEELHLGSDAALRHLLRRYANLSLTSAGERSALRGLLIDAFLREVSPTAPPASRLLRVGSSG